MGSNLILCIHEKHNFSRAAHSWFTDKMNSSSTNLQPPDWCCDVCNVKLNWAALSPGGRGSRLEAPSSETGGGKPSGRPAMAALLPEQHLLSWLLYLFFCASCIAQVLVFKCFTTQLWLTAPFACSAGVSACWGSHLLRMIVGLPPVTALCTVPAMSTPWRFRVDGALQSFLSFPGATSQRGTAARPLQPLRAVSLPPRCME